MGIPALLGEPVLLPRLNNKSRSFSFHDVFYKTKPCRYKKKKKITNKNNNNNIPDNCFTYYYSADSTWSRMLEAKTKDKAQK